jgi:GTP-binding protein LepA
MMAANAVYQVERCRRVHAQAGGRRLASPGEVGFLTAQIKQVADTQVGDTITDERRGTETPLAGFKPAQQVVFCGLFPVDAAQFEDLRDALSKLHLNDASFTYEMETSAALGFGFRCGVLGPPAPGDHPRAAGARVQSRADHHRAERDLQIFLTNGEMLELHNPADMPDVVRIDTSRSRGSRRRCSCRTNISAAS